MSSGHLPHNNLLFGGTFSTKVTVIQFGCQSLEDYMLFAKMRSKYRRFKYHNQFERPALVLTVDLFLFASKMLLLVGFFGGLIYFLPTL